jgi:diadenosine tetraphosphate (Ap4A) HIT family hydrolase
MTPSERLIELSEGLNPRLVLRMRSGFAVMGDNQFLPGYCLLMAYPQVDQLIELPEKQRHVFLEDMSLLGEAIDRVTESKRINFAMYGNVDPFLHAHVWPRYEWEVPEFATLPPLSIPEEVRMHADTVWDPAVHGNLQNQIREMILKVQDERASVDIVH